MLSFNNIKILSKIALVFALLLAISTVVNIISFTSMTTQEKAADWTDHTHAVLGTVSNIVAAMVDQETGMRGYLLSGDEKFLAPQKAGAKAYAENIAEVRNLTSDNPAQQKRLDELATLVEGWTNDVVVQEMKLMTSKDTAQQARDLEVAGVGKKWMDQIRTKAAEIGGVEQQLLSARSAAASDSAATARFAIIAGALIMIASGLLMLFVLNRGMIRPIAAMTAVMGRLAQGDTSISVVGAKRKDEIGAMANAVEVFRQAAMNNRELEAEAAATRGRQAKEQEAINRIKETEAGQLAFATQNIGVGLKRLASGDLAFQLDQEFAPAFEPLRQDFNQSVRQLATALSEIAHSISSMDNGTREIAAGAEDLSRRTEQQASSLEQTAAALDEITTNVANSTKRTEEARVVASQANQSAVRSVDVVSHAERAMRKIEESSQEISNIIGVIDEIAFQTNLLALNAGVEAARAGDAGKGFAVVAQEVRELAQRSAQAAKEIKELIHNSSSEVENGVRLVRDTGEALKTISGFIVEINGHMESIAISAREQSTGLGEVNAAVNSMDQTTQQNAAMVEQSTAASNTLAQEAAKLRNLVSQFTLSSARPVLPRAAARDSRPVASPARALTRRLAGAFGGVAAAASAANEWEEF
ncbi:methyl-accepting chemotaxis protein (plasmid) [Rhizobium sp. CB3171]|uniref:methyl-accepting chemotaxis protein n=1 Tax=Rhizobium sp. CB3171 TaxID=3039157 RepID=UPI0024B03F08|nr:methyl-accepting chemotaxis protein [Rhizobium sp. CB3171]WFU06604.1 methyl-accepting chemotaxis protein [Rhizobium sp. CB3171]